MHDVRWQRSWGPEFCLPQREEPSLRDLRGTSPDTVPTAQVTSCVPALGLSTSPVVPPPALCTPPCSPLAGLSTLPVTPRITEASMSQILGTSSPPFGDAATSYTCQSSNHSTFSASLQHFSTRPLQRILSQSPLCSSFPPEWALTVWEPCDKGAPWPRETPGQPEFLPAGFLRAANTQEGALTCSTWFPNIFTPEPPFHRAPCGPGTVAL